MTEPLKRTTIVIPTYNERDNIQELIPALLALGSGVGVLVVDDSSPDGTAAVVRQMGASDSRVGLSLRVQRQGIGPAYIARFQQALRDGADY
ncbi:MAG: glycosyltransferase, partial [Deltaproteobacteria bacterium]|nr:glycosyltransferase [Deltaproteobacteria bacterium]